MRSSWLQGLQIAWRRWREWFAFLADPQYAADNHREEPVESGEQPLHGKPARSDAEMRAGLSAVRGVAPVTEAGPLLQARAEGWLAVPVPELLGPVRTLRLLRRRGFPAKLRDELVLVRQADVPAARTTAEDHQDKLQTGLLGPLLLYRGPLLVALLLGVGVVLVAVTSLVWSFTRNDPFFSTFDHPPLLTLITCLALAALAMGLMLGSYQLFMLPRVQDWLEDNVASYAPHRPPKQPPPKTPRKR